jgi:hypothetical protein
MAIIFLLQMSLALKIIQVLIASTLKFVVAPMLAKQLGFFFVETFLLTTAGGIAGVVFFFYLSAALFRFFGFIGRKLRIRKKAAHAKPARRKKKFTRKNKFIVKLRGKYGMFGIIALTPPLLSIPLGSVLANKYFAGNKRVLLYLFLSVAFWSGVFTSLYYFAF